MKNATCILICCMFFLQVHTQSLFDKGYAAYMNDHLDSAVSLFTKSINQKTDVVNCTLYRAASYIFLLKFDSAETDLNTVKKVDSLFPKLNYYYGKLCLLSSNYTKALAYYERELQINPGSALAYADRGNVKFFLHDFSGAIADDSKAIEIDSSDQTFYNDRGYVKLKLKQYTEAINDFLISIRLEPNQKAYTNSGLAYFLLDMQDKAITAFTNALALNANDAETLYLRACAYKKTGNMQSACRDMQQSMSLNYAEAIKEYKEMNCH